MGPSRLLEMASNAIPAEDPGGETKIALISRHRVDPESKYCNSFDAIKRFVEIN